MIRRALTFCALIVVLVVASLAQRTVGEEQIAFTRKATRVGAWADGRTMQVRVLEAGSAPDVLVPSLWDDGEVVRAIDRWTVVRVEVRAFKETVRSASWAVQDAHGRVYRSTDRWSDEAVMYHPGIPVRQWIAFELPRGVKAKELLVDHRARLDTKLVLRLPVARRSDLIEMTRAQSGKEREG